MPRADMVECEGVVTECLPNTMFRVKLNDHPKLDTVMCTLAGKLRMNYIRVLTGDRVTVQMSPYDLTKGRIIWRSK